MSSEVVHVGCEWSATKGIRQERICSAMGEVLYDDPRYLVVHTDTQTIHIPHGRVIAIVEPKETQ